MLLNKSEIRIKRKLKIICLQDIKRTAPVLENFGKEQLQFELYLFIFKDISLQDFMNLICKQLFDELNICIRDTVQL